MCLCICRSGRLGPALPTEAEGKDCRVWDDSVLFIAAAFGRLSKSAQTGSLLSPPQLGRGCEDSPDFSFYLSPNAQGLEFSGRVAV